MKLLDRLSGSAGQSAAEICQIIVTMASPIRIQPMVLTSKRSGGSSWSGGNDARHDMSGECGQAVRQSQQADDARVRISAEAQEEAR